VDAGSHDSFEWKRSAEWGYVPARRGRDRVWLHVLLFLLTILTTATLGARLAQNFQLNLPAFNIDRDWTVFLEAARQPTMLLEGLPYAFTLLLILTAHEMGHYLACRYYGIDASLPFFLPAPTFIGTFGAFIRFRSAVPGRRELFDVGVAGPLAGFLFVIPTLGLGLALSKIVPGIDRQSEMVLGSPLLLRLLEMWVFPGAPAQDIYLHPVARAAWVGMLATALNLLPVGQLDGGHVVYACFGEKHRAISIGTCLALLPLGFLYWPWVLWAVALFFLGRKHFTVYEDAPLGRGRYRLLAVALVIFALCFIPAPVQVQ
jgi:membrane-associated protease RseP (regulator of RpoE activity)